MLTPEGCGRIKQAKKRQMPEPVEETEYTNSWRCGGMSNIWGLLSLMGVWLESEGCSL